MGLLTTVSFTCSFDEDEAVRVLLRGNTAAGNGGEAAAYLGGGARKAVAAEDDKVAASLHVASKEGGNKTYFIVQKDE